MKKLSNTILEIRTKNGLTQDEFADKLHVTRQAVSRWENDETTPSIETLKIIAEMFKVDGNALRFLRGA
jgi:transcriptional regulator with XRE-family HTH domain